MDERMNFINSVLADMQTKLDAEDLDTLKITLIRKMENMSLTQATMLMKVSNNSDVNERYFRLFVASRRLEGISDKTIIHYIYEARKMVTLLDKDIPDITTMDVQYYLSEYERRHNVSRRTLDNMRLSINGVFIWLLENDYISKNPMSPIKPISYEKKSIETLTETEIYDIRESVRGDLRTRAIIELLLATGIRVSELCAINIEDVNLENKEIVIHCAKKRRKQDRVLFLTVEAIKALEKYLSYRMKLSSRDGSPLFMSNRNKGRRVTERLVNTSLRNIEKEVGLKKKLTVHMFRKTLASLLYRRGMQPLDIAHILGHADTRMGETYYIGVKTDEVKNNYYRYR